MAISALLGLGLSLLSEVPSLWKPVASIVGKVVPSSVSEAASLAGEVMSSMNKGEVSDEAFKKMEEEFDKHSEELAAASLKEMESLKELEIAAYKSGNKYVAETRPKILRRMFWLAAIFTFFAPISTVLGVYVGMSDAVFALYLPLLKWTGGFVFTTFTTAFTGYTVARTVDKRNPEFKNGHGLLNTIVKKVIG